MTTLPERSPHPEASSERRLSAQEFERVLRRAAELQASDGTGSGGGTITEGEAVQIGRGLGLSVACLYRALSETQETAPPAGGKLARWLGPEVLRAGRVIQGGPDRIARTLERYLVEREHLVVLRRFGDRVVFTRAIGVPAKVKRAVSRVVRRSAPLAVTTLEVTAHRLDDTTTYLALSTSVPSHRTATVAGGAGGVGLGAAGAAGLLAAGAVPEAALLALPLFGVGVAAVSRASRLKSARRVQIQLESLLDRVEHGDLPPPRLSRAGPRWWPQMQARPNAAVALRAPEAREGAGEVR